jgi:hypothetical protein
MLPIWGRSAWLILGPNHTLGWHDFLNEAHPFIIAAVLTAEAFGGLAMKQLGDKRITGSKGTYCDVVILASILLTFISALFYSIARVRIETDSLNLDNASIAAVIVFGCAICIGMLAVLAEQFAPGASPTTAPAGPILPAPDQF